VRILIHSNAPWAATGYGVQTRIFAPRIRDLGHEVGISAFYGLEGASIQWQGMNVYPKAFHPYGMDVVAQHAREMKADIVLTLIDGWVMDPARITAGGAKWVPWFPVDHDPLPHPVREKVKHAYQPIVYSRHAEKAATDAGLDVRYVPHGVDTNVYSPMPQDEARKKLGLPADAFVIGIVAANKGVPSRKALPTQLEAFARFYERHPEAILYLHTHLGTEMEGLDVAKLIEGVGIPGSAVRVCDQYRNIMGYADTVMAALYSAMDVLSSVTMGEGFGVPIIEAQACGTPVIVGGWTAMPELVGSGLVVPPEDAERMFTPMGAYQYLPRIEAVLDSYEQAYAVRGDERVRTEARDFALQYDADTVTQDYWKPVLAKIEQRISGAESDAPPVEVLAA
jgi:glycosyltransferase involved in cell wall biosynthesis